MEPSHTAGMPPTLGAILGPLGSRGSSAMGSAGPKSIAAAATVLHCTPLSSVMHAVSGQHEAAKGLTTALSSGVADSMQA